MQQENEDDIAKEIKFYEVCALLEKIHTTKAPNSKEKILKRYLTAFNEFSQEFRQRTNVTEVSRSSFFPILRLLLPASDTSRTSYGIQINSMGKILINVLNLGPNSDDAKKLGYTSSVSGCHDFADVVYDVMKRRARVNVSSLTVLNIHRLLDIIASTNRKVIEEKFTEFIQASSALEQKWLIRIILKKLHLKLGEQKIFNLYHPSAKEFYDRHTDLVKVCECVERGEEVQAGDIVALFQHIRPMLCENKDLSTLAQIFTYGDYFLETKMDGERFHMHMANGKFKYISRGGHDYTSHFGASQSEGNLTPMLSRLLDLSVKNVILDGEMMVWDKEDSSYRVKGEYIDVKNLQLAGSLRPCFVVYDILYLNDVCHINKPYAERVSLLRKIVKEQRGILNYCKQVTVTSVAEVIENFNQALDDNEEGIVIKGRGTVYQPGKRNGGGWYKLKPDYIHGVLSDIDMLIIGGFYDRKQNYIASYLLGVQKKSDNENTDAPLFYSVTKVGSGLSSKTRRSLNEMLKPHWITVDKVSKTNPQDSHPPCIDWGNWAPDVWIEPKNSVILQVKATELVATKSFRTSHTLRFPRIEKVRSDKLWNEGMTLEDFEDLRSGSGGVQKINKRHITENDFDSPKKKKLSPSKRMKIDAYAKHLDFTAIEKVSNACEGLNFCVLTSSRQYPSVDELKKLVIKHGGEIVENPTPDKKSCICIAGDETFRVKNLLRTGKYNIVSVNWLIRAFGQDTLSEQLLKLKPRDMICSTVDMDEDLRIYYDQYGDSYMDVVDDEELKLLLQDLDKVHPPELLDREMCELENEIFNGVCTYNFFRLIRAVFYTSDDCPANMSDMMKLAMLSLQARGGSVLSEISKSGEKKALTHVFVDKENIDVEDVAFWLEFNLESQKDDILIVDCNWLIDCDSKSTKLDVSNYSIVL